MTTDQILGSVKIRQSTICYAGLLGRWDKRIVDQESDVPSIIFFYKITKIKIKSFECSKSIKSKKK